MASVTFKFLLNDTVRDDDTQLVLLRITYERRHKYVGTGVYLRQKHFNPEGTYDKQNWVRKTFGDPSAVATQNGILNAWLDRGDLTKQKLVQLGQPFTADDVKQRMLATSGDSLAAFIRETIARYYSRDQRGTALNHEYTLRAVCDFLDLDKLTGDFTLQQLTPAVLEGLETYLLTRKIRRKTGTTASRRNTVNESLRRLHFHIRRFIIKHKLPDELDPLRGRTFDSAPTRRFQLNDAELLILATGSLPDATKGERRLNDVRNIYLCSYFLHGLRARDLIMARVSQLAPEWAIEDGQAVRHYRFLTTALKTEKTKAIRVEAEILPVLLAYAQDKQPDDFLFPFLSAPMHHLSPVDLENKAKSQNVYINGRLKVIARLLNINKPIAMHSARHTFADLLMEETGDIRLVQAALDHSEIGTTERYFSRGSKQSLTDKANNLYRRQAATRATALETINAETILKHD